MCSKLGIDAKENQAQLEVFKMSISLSEVWLCLVMYTQILTCPGKRFLYRLHWVTHDIKRYVFLEVQVIWMYELISSFKALSFKGFCPISNDKMAQITSKACIFSHLLLEPFCCKDNCRRFCLFIGHFSFFFWLYACESVLLYFWTTTLRIFCVVWTVFEWVLKCYCYFLKCQT